MQARMKHPVQVHPAAMTALQALRASTVDRGVPAATLALVELRASQINGCGACCDLHARHMRADGETPERLAAVAAWRHTTYFTDAERAALALTEALTRLADREDPVPDVVWAAAARHHDESALAALVLAIATINVWNRLNAAVGQIAASW